MATLPTPSAASVVAPLIAAAPERSGPRNAKPTTIAAEAVASLVIMPQYAKVELARKSNLRRNLWPRMLLLR